MTPARPAGARGEARRARSLAAIRPKSPMRNAIAARSGEMMNAANNAQISAASQKDATCMYRTAARSIRRRRRLPWSHPARQKRPIARRGKHEIPNAIACPARYPPLGRMECVRAVAVVSILVTLTTQFTGRQQAGKTAVAAAAQLPVGRLFLRMAPCVRMVELCYCCCRCCSSRTLLPIFECRQARGMVL